MEALYQQARRFDEGEFCQSAAYLGVVNMRNKLLDMLVKLTGPGFGELNELTMSALDQEIELECQHYFCEGYLAAKREMENIR